MHFALSAALILAVVTLVIKHRLIEPETNLLTAFVFGTIGTVGLAVFGRGIPVPVIDREV